MNTENMELQCNHNKIKTLMHIANETKDTLPRQLHVKTIK